MRTFMQVQQFVSVYLPVIFLFYSFPFTIVSSLLSLLFVFERSREETTEEHRALRFPLFTR